MCQDMVFRKPMPFMCTRSQHRVDFLSIKDSLGYIWYYDMFHTIDLVAEFFALRIWPNGSIHVLSHPEIFS